jgi:hypothetical protein
MQQVSERRGIHARFLGERQRKELPGKPRSRRECNIKIVLVI